MYTPNPSGVFAFIILPRMKEKTLPRIKEASLPPKTIYNLE
jgi:hypothetical protein